MNLQRLMFIVRRNTLKKVEEHSLETLLQKKSRALKDSSTRQVSKHLMILSNP